MTSNHAKLRTLWMRIIHNIPNIRSVIKLATILRNTLLMKPTEHYTTRRKRLSITKSVTGFSSIFPVALLVVLTTRLEQCLPPRLNSGQQTAYF